MPDDVERLLATLPYWTARRKWRVVVKLGGSATEEPAALRATLQDMAWLRMVSQRVVVVHGGGKRIDRALALAEIVPKRIDGRRVTDDATLAIVVRVLAGEINPDLVSQLNSFCGSAVGLNQVLFGSLLFPEGELGRVGAIDRVDTDWLDADTAAGEIPVLPSLALDAHGNWLNVNADDAAAAVAVHWKADILVFLTDTPGLLHDVNDSTSRIGRLNRQTAEGLIASGAIAGGMVPKVQGCMDALDRGVGRVQILDGRVPHALVHEAFTGQCAGTEFIA